jgi:hypothetical protein
LTSQEEEEEEEKKTKTEAASEPSENINTKKNIKSREEIENEPSVN